MAHYNSLNVKLSYSQLNKLKSAIKNKGEVVLRLSWDMIGNSDLEANFRHKLLLTNRKVTNLRKVVANNSSTDITLSKTQLSKMIQSGGFLDKLLGLLLKTGVPLTKTVIKPLARSVLIPLGLTAAASVADTGKSNDETEDIIWTVKSLEDSGVLVKGVSETIQNEVKQQKGGFRSMLLGTLGANLLGNILADKEMSRAGDKQRFTASSFN